MKKTILILTLICGTMLAWLDYHVVGTLAEGDSITAIVLDDTLLYASDGMGGVIVANISDPTAPTMSYSLTRPGETRYAANLFLFGDSLLVIDKDLPCWDISDPTAPVFLDIWIPFSGYQYSATRWGDTVAVTYSNSFFIADYSNLLSPVALGYGHCEFILDDIAKVGNLIAVKHYDNNIYLFDISTPTAPESLFAFTLDDSVRTWGVRALDDTLLFIGGGVLNLANPSAPELISVIPDIARESAFSDWCKIVNDTAYMVALAWHDSLQPDLTVVDLTNPIMPEIISEVVFPDWVSASAIAVRNDTVFVGYYKIGHAPGIAILARGSSAIDETAPAKPAALKLTAHPNPFNSSVRISVETPSLSPPQAGEMPQAEGVQIDIFDLNGRRVETPRLSADPLLKGVSADGLTPLTKGGQGGSCIWQPDPSIGSGVYLVRATFPQQTASRAFTKRLVYLK